MQLLSVLAFITPLQIFIAVDVVVVLAVLIWLFVKYCKKAKGHNESEQPLIKPEKDAEDAVKETVEGSPQDQEQLFIGDIEEDFSPSKRIPFKDKLFVAEEVIQGYVREIDNAFRSLKKVNARLSLKGVSYRNGKTLIAKLTIRGKTLKLHLALSVVDYNERVYFQKDMQDVKEYAEVPFTVKVKSDRGLKNALKLVEDLAKKFGIEKKAKTEFVDSVALYTAEN